jgi:ribosomal protein S18 acetylase RimI-like enzyme
MSGGHGPVPGDVEMKAAVLTRDATASDIETLLALDEIARTDADRSAFIRNAVAGGTCLVAEHEGRVVGYGVLDHAFFGHGFVSMLYVAASRRRQGVGGVLLRALARRCTTAKLFTSTNASNEPMQRLLVRSGFARSGIIHNLDPGDPEFVYVLLHGPSGG